MDAELSLRRLAPTPIQLAAAMRCVAESWHQESVLLCMHSNISLLEHPATTLSATSVPEPEDAGPAEVEKGQVESEDTRDRKRQRHEENVADQRQLAIDLGFDLEEACAQVIEGREVRQMARRLVKRQVERLRGLPPGFLDQYDKEVKEQLTKVLAQAAEQKRIAAALRVVRPVSRTHTITPNIAVFIAGSASSRKSSMISRTTEFMTGSSGVPSEIAQRDIMNVEAPPKGIRTALVNFQRCSTTSDEINNTFQTPWSDTQAACH